MAQSVAYAIETQAHDGTGLVDLRFGSPGWTSRPTDTPAGKVFVGRVVNAGNFSLHAFASGRTGGRGDVGSGTITLANADGALDALKSYGWGRRITVRRGLVDGLTMPAYPAGWAVVFAGVVEQAEVTRDVVRLLIRDRQAEVADLPMSAVKFDGSNVLPAGVEGGADIKGKVKARIYGAAYNFAPRCCNTSRLIYQISQGALQVVSAVYDRAAVVTPGTARASLAALQSNTPTAGTFDWYLGSGGDGAYIRLGTTPSGEVTVDATEGATAADRTAAQVWKRILLGPGGLSSGDIDAAAVAALDAANDAEIGIWVGEETTVGDVLDKVAASVGAFWGITRAGLFTISRFELPTGTPVTTFTDSDFGADIDRVAGNDVGAGKGVWQVVLNYRVNHTVQTSDLAGSVTAARRQVLAQAGASVTASDATVKTQYPLADQVEVDTLLVDETRAATEAARILALRKVARDYVDLTVSAGRAGTIEIGAVVAVRLARYGWDGGKLFRVIGRTEDHDDVGAVRLSLFG
ncbi:MAG: hypothetical protein J0H82_25940 [Alphaproteobacteria bacterium]|jgi:hypothetical protein|nr:hypothetical protein [Alphaproteobacteria bacterium]